MATTEEIYTELREVFDPEIPVNIVDLGLIYDVNVDGPTCNIRMTLTSQACPEARLFLQMTSLYAGPTAYPLIFEYTVVPEESKK